MTERKNTIGQRQEAAEALAAEQAQAAETEAAERAQAQLASAGGPLHEVLTEAANGHRTVHRFRAQSVEAARTAVEAELPAGSVILDADVAGNGLGSSDGR
jgi:phage/plasmid primase-like uncharacterized protein